MAQLHLERHKMDRIGWLRAAGSSASPDLAAAAGPAAADAAIRMQTAGRAGPETERSGKLPHDERAATSTAPKLGRST